MGVISRGNSRWAELGLLKDLGSFPPFHGFVTNSVLQGWQAHIISDVGNVRAGKTINLETIKSFFFK